MSRFSRIINVEDLKINELKDTPQKSIAATFVAKTFIYTGDDTTPRRRGRRDNLPPVLPLPRRPPARASSRSGRKGRASNEEVAGRSGPGSRRRPVGFGSGCGAPTPAPTPVPAPARNPVAGAGHDRPGGGGPFGPRLHLRSGRPARPVPFAARPSREIARAGRRPPGNRGHRRSTTIVIHGIWKTRTGYVAQVRATDNKSYLVRRATFSTTERSRASARTKSCSARTSTIRRA